ncbi:MAG: UDP-glucose 6-dehydrogenase [Spongiibacteraceae bacterium]|nr:UDP-glucose 6-dehydrogenase [Spongiibacteraceae bacterium]
MRITVVGCGYVGLVTGVCFTEMGNSVTCVDVNEQRLSELRSGRLPIYEPGLAEMMAGAVAENLLQFSSDLAAAIQEADYIFNAVGTPPQPDGSVDLGAVLAVAKTIGDNINRYAVVVNKSTVPVGTAERVGDIIVKQLSNRGVDVTFDVVSNPEFLKEGTAIADFMGPDRVIIGAGSDRARRKMAMLYAPYLKKNDRIMFMGLREAELTKYAANAMLATRISFMNEIAGLCDKLGVDIEDVRQGVGSDKRIGNAFLYPGCGYGGSCFPKDVQALMYAGKEVGVDMALLAEVEERNARQKDILFEKLSTYFGGELDGKKIAVWGLAFKPGTDDIREAPSIRLILSMLKAGVRVAAYDPKAMTATDRYFAGLALSEGITFSEDQYGALENADALILVTEWKRFRSPDFAGMKRRMRGQLILDGRNQYAPDMLAELGFDHIGIGRKNWSAYE